MSETQSGDAHGGAAGWLLFSFAMPSVIVASVGLSWLLWVYVPRQVALCEEFGLALPLLTRLVIALSMWTIRLLPLLVLIGVPALGVGSALTVVWAVKNKAVPRVVRWAAALAFFVALMEILMAAAVVYSFRLALDPPAPAQLSQEAGAWSRHTA
jgi:type II secretory pathway component PulF